MYHQIGVVETNYKEYSFPDFSFFFLIKEKIQTLLSSTMLCPSLVKIIDKKK